MKKRALLICITTLTGLLFLGCATSGAAPEVSVKTGQNILIEPAAKEQKIVHLSVKSSDETSPNMEERIKNGLQAKGYELTDNSETAVYVLVVGVSSLTKKASTDKKDDYGVSSAIKSETKETLKSGNKKYGADSASNVLSNISDSIIDSLTEKIGNNAIYEAKVDIYVKQKLKKQTDQKTSSTITVTKSKGLQDALLIIEEKIAQQVVNLF